MEKLRQSHTPEIWGGIECTINRIGDVYKDQLSSSGHYDRPDDLEHICSLGLSRMRFPILWEYLHVENNSRWQRIERQLRLLHDNKIVPIAGLLHHGSGPEHTDLMDEDFPIKLASFAGSVAERFPSIEYFTPVNEPLTTARFSGLYGFWYPHHRSGYSFLKMLLNQVKGIVLAMQHIRKINPHAKLIQTEDLSKTHSTPALTYQAEFENERRWLTYDLLCGKIDRHHSLWNYFISEGISQRDLEFFRENTCCPDTMGFNYYVTSERVLDDRICNHPLHMHGGNGRDCYVDIEAAGTGYLQGIEKLLHEAWQRFRIPLAVTECHLNGSENDQLLWWKETWEACCNLNRDGIAVQAITAWSLLGAYDWNSLMLDNSNYYEKGVFDISNGKLRPTVLAKMLHQLNTSKQFSFPLPKRKGWWHENQLKNASVL